MFIDNLYVSLVRAYFCARLQNNVQQTPAEKERESSTGLKMGQSEACSERTNGQTAEPNMSVAEGPFMSLIQ